MQPAWLTLHEAATCLGLSYRQVLRMRGDLPQIAINRRMVRVPADAVLGVSAEPRLPRAHLTLSELAELLRVPPPTLARWARDRGLRDPISALQIAAILEPPTRRGPDTSPLAAERYLFLSEVAMVLRVPMDHVVAQVVSAQLPALTLAPGMVRIEAAAIIPGAPGPLPDGRHFLAEDLAGVWRVSRATIAAFLVDPEPWPRRTLLRRVLDATTGPDL